MTIKPKDNYLVTVEKKYTDEIVLSNGIKLFIDPSWNPTVHVSITGKIASLPINNSLNLKLNDEVIFSYVVIGQRDYTSTADVFHSLFEKYNSDFQRFMNGRGEAITIVSFPGVISKIYACCHLDQRGHLIGEGMQGSHSQMERWKSKFTFDGGGTFKYKNLIQTSGNDLWICKPEYIFSIKKGKKLIPISDRLILKPINVEIPKDILSEMMIKVPESSVFTRYYDRGELIHYDKETKIKKGQIVGFEPKYVERYDIDGKEHFLIRRRRILGIYENVS